MFLSVCSFTRPCGDRSHQKNIGLCLVSAQVNAYPPIRPSLREYFGVFLVTWCYSLPTGPLFFFPPSAGQSEHSCNYNTYNNSTKVEPSLNNSASRSCQDNLWHHPGGISLSRRVSQKTLKEESKKNKKTFKCFQTEAPKVLFPQNGAWNLRKASRQTEISSCSPHRALQQSPRSGRICTAM